MFPFRLKPLAITMALVALPATAQAQITLWDALSTSGQSYERQEFFSDAARVYRGALDAGMKVFGPEDPRMGETVVRLASTLRRSGQIGEASKILDRHLAFIDNPDHHASPIFLSGLQELALIQESREDYPAAVVAMSRAVEISSNIHGPTNLETAERLDELGRLQEKAGHDADAKATWMKSDELKYTWNLTHPDHLVDIPSRTGSGKPVSGRFQGPFAAVKAWFLRLWESV